MLYLIAGLEAASGGALLAFGAPSPDRRRSAALIFQETSLLPWLSVWQNVSFGLSLRGVPEAERRSVARAALQRVGLAEAFDKRPDELSGGMRQARGGGARARHAPEGPADGRALRGPRRPDPPEDAGLPARRLARQRRLGAVRDPPHRRWRWRSPTGWWCSRPGPGGSRPSSATTCPARATRSPPRPRRCGGTSPSASARRGRPGLRRAGSARLTSSPTRTRPWPHR